MLNTSNSFFSVLFKSHIEMYGIIKQKFDTDAYEELDEEVIFLYI